MMKIYKTKILAICTAVLLLTACKKDDAKRADLAEGLVTFDLPASEDVVEYPLNVKEASVFTMEMKAVLTGSASSDVHYVTFAPDTTKMAEYKLKYGNNATLLPAINYLYYKQTVAIPAGSNISEPAVLNVGFQTLLRPRSTYVLPLAITSVDGKVQDPVTRRVVYYVFKTGEALYIDHTGFALVATTSSVSGANAGIRAFDANTLGTYWLSSPAQSLPQWVSVDFARQITTTGIDVYFPTAVNYNTLGGDPTSAKVETSLDGTTWTDRGTHAIDVRNANRKQIILFPSPLTIKYLRFTVLTGNPYASGAVRYSLTAIGGLMMRN